MKGQDTSQALGMENMVSPLWDFPSKEWGSGGKMLLPHLQNVGGY